MAFAGRLRKPPMTNTSIYCAEEGTGIATINRADLQRETIERLAALREEFEAGKFDQPTLVKQMRKAVDELFAAMGW